MKTISFFSEKGGVGKSSFTIMYASALKYKYGVKVGIADFNKRIESYRKAEINNRELKRKSNPDIPPFDIENAWPIYTIKNQEIANLQKMGYQTPYATWLDNLLKNELNDMDVVLLDFPGSLSGKEFIQVAGMHMINLIVIPTEKDEMTLQSTNMLHGILQNNRTNHCVFINKAQLGLRNLRATYLKLAEVLIRRGFPMLPDMVTYSEKMMSIDKIDNFRSTFQFPDFNLPEFGASKDLGIQNLFIDITRELNKTPDLKGTSPADLSFVKDLQKTSDNRQLSGTPYPQYEII